MHESSYRGAAGISAAVVAGVYTAVLAPIGVLLGVAGYILGIYVPIIIARALSWWAG